MTTHRFLALDYMNKLLHYIDEAHPERNWQAPTEAQLHDMQLIGGGRLAVTRSDGWATHDIASGRELERVKIEGVGGLSAIRFLPDGRVYAGLNGAKGVEILELSSRGEILNRFDFSQRKHIRQLHRTPQGTWLMTHHDGGLEISLEGPGRELKSFRLPGARYAYMLLRKANGNFLLSGGYSKTSVEFAPDGRAVREYSAPQPEGMRSFYYAGFQILENGNLVQANWTGHNESDYEHGLKLFEFDSAGKIVWSWTAPKERVGSITAFAIVDELDLSALNDDVAGVLKAL